MDDLLPHITIPAFSDATPPPGEDPILGETWDWFEERAAKAYGTDGRPPDITLGSELVSISPVIMGDGPSEILTFRIPVEMGKRLTYLTNNGVTGYHRVSDLARDGLFLLGWYIVNKLKMHDPALYGWYETKLAAATAGHQTDADRQIVLFGHHLREALLMRLASDELDSAYKVLMEHWHRANNNPDEYHRRRCLTVFTTLPTIRVCIRLLMEAGYTLPDELAEVMASKPSTVFERLTAEMKEEIA